MQTTQTYNFSTIEIFTRVAYSLTLQDSNNTRNFADVLESGATNFNFNEYNIEIKNSYGISSNGNVVNVAIDSSGKGLDFIALRAGDDFCSGEIFIKFKLTKKSQSPNEGD